MFLVCFSLPWVFPASRFISELAAGLIGVFPACRGFLPASRDCSVSAAWTFGVFPACCGCNSASLDCWSLPLTYWRSSLPTVWVYWCHLAHPSQPPCFLGQPFWYCECFDEADFGLLVFVSV